MNTSKALEIEASSLVEQETPVNVITIPVKSEADLVPPGVKVREKHSGAGYGFHPVLKRFVSFKKLRPDQIELFPVPGAAAQASPGPVASPAPAHSLPLDRESEAFLRDMAKDPGAALPGAQAGAQAANGAQAEARPDFSDLPDPDGDYAGAGGDDGQAQRDYDSEETSHRVLVTTVFDGFTGGCAMIFGPEWKPQDAAEKSEVVERWVKAFTWMGIQVLNPLQIAYVASANYCIKRVGTLVRWFRGKKKPKPPIDVETVRTDADGRNGAKPEASTAKPETEPFTFDGEGVI